VEDAEQISVRKNYRSLIVLSPLVKKARVLLPLFLKSKMLRNEIIDHENSAGAGSNHLKYFSLGVGGYKIGTGKPSTKLMQSCMCVAVQGVLCSIQEL